MEQERHHCHVQRAALWNAAWVEVGLPQAPSNSVVEKARGVKVSISSQGARGETRQLKKANKQPQLNLVETFIEVGTATADLLALQFSIRELEVDNVPRIFCPERRSGASEEVVCLPRLDPG